MLLSRSPQSAACSLFLALLLIAGPALEAGPAIAFANEAEPRPFVPSLVADDRWREPIRTTARPTPGADDRAAPAEQAVTVEASATVVRELTDKRSENVTQFLLSDGNIRAEITQEPTRFRDEDGELVDIDPSLVPAAESGAVQTAATSSTVTLDRQEPTEAPVSLSGPGYSVGLDMLGVAEQARVVYGDTVRYFDVAQDADLEYQATRTGVKETVVLRSADAPSEFTFRLDLDRVQVRQDPWGNHSLYRVSDGERLFDLGSLVVFDSSEDEAGEPAYCPDATMTVTQDGAGDAIVTYEVPDTWLSDPDRAFPVMVDPTLEGNTNGQDTYAGNAAPTATHGGSEVLKCGYRSNDGRNRSFLRFFWSGSDIPAGAYVRSGELRVFVDSQHSGSASGNHVDIGRLGQPFSSGTTNWNNMPTDYTWIGSPSSVGKTGQNIVFEAGPTVQAWVSDYSTNYGFTLYQHDTSAENTTYYKQFCSSDHPTTSRVPQLVVTYSNPSINTTNSSVDKAVYRLGDTVTAKLRINTALPEDINAIKVNVNSDATRRRGSFLWSKTVPDSSDWRDITACPGTGGGEVSWDPNAAGSDKVDLLETQCYENVIAGNGYAEVTFRWKVLDNYGDVQDSDLDVQVFMDPVDKNVHGNRWSSATLNYDSNFDVAPRPLTELSVTKTASKWFSESVSPSTGVVDDTNDDPVKGRGSLVASWTPTTGALGYRVLLSDGNAEREVGRTFGSTATTFTTSGLGIYPSDSAIAGFGTTLGTRNPFGSSPIEASSLITPLTTNQAGTGVIVTDGTDLYVHKWGTAGTGPTAWWRLDKTSGANVKQVGVSSGRSYYSAAMIDGKIYEGYAVTKQTLEGIWKDEPSTSSARSTMTLSHALLARSNLVEVTGATGDVMITADSEARKLYSISNDTMAASATFKIREYQINSTGNAATLVADRMVSVPGQSAFTDVKGLFAARGQLFLMERDGKKRVLRIDADGPNAWQANGLWVNDGGNPYASINACYDPVSRSVFVGQYDKPGIRRYAGPELDLRDDPKKLYAATPGTTNDAKAGYQIRVVPFNSADPESDVSGHAAMWCSLDNRTVRVDQDPRHTSYDLGGIIGAEAAALLEGGSRSLSLSATDLKIASYGPEAELSRTYDSTSTTSTRLSPGWRFNFEQTIAPASADATRVVYTDDAGERHVFSKQQGQWFSPNGFTGTIARNDNGLLPDTWTITFKDMSVLTFTDAGVLDYETDCNGNKVDYDIPTGDGVVKITAANGQSIEATVSGGKVTGARYVAGSKQRRVDYSASGGTLGVTYFPDLSGEQVVTRYDYTASRITSASIVGQQFAGTEARWNVAYGTGGRLESVTGPALKQGGARPTTTFSYDYDTATELDIATVSRPAKVAGSDATVLQRYGANPSGTMAFVSNERVAGEPETMTTYQYSPANELLTEKTPTGKLTERVYDSNSNVIYAYDEMRHLDTYRYDVLNRLTSHVDPRGCATYVGYETSTTTNVDWVEQDLNAIERARSEFDYDSKGRVTLQRSLISVDATAGTSLWLATKYPEYADSGAPKRVEQLAQRKEANGSYTDQPITLGGQTSATSIVTTSEIDEFGQVTAQTDAGGLVTMSGAQYTPAGKLLSSVDVDGVTTRFRYDALGNVLETSQTVEATSGPAFAEWHRYEVDAYGRTVRESDVASNGADSAWTEHEFDAAGNEILTTDSIEGTTTRWFDARGNLTHEWAPGAGAAGSDNLQAASRWAFDHDGVEQWEVEAGKADSDKVTKQWRPDGLVDKVIDADGSWVRYEYDDGGNQTAEISPTDDGGESAERTYYDIAGRVIAQESSDGLTTHTEYDRAGRPTRVYTSRQTEEEDEEGNITVSTVENAVSQTVYNEIGWVLESGDADGVVKNSVYDVLGNSIEESVWASGAQKSVTSYTYDSKKRVKTQTVMEADKANTITYDYDKFGRVVSEVHTKDGVTSRDVDTTYDEFGRATGVTDNETGVTTRYDYAAGSKKTSATNISFGSVSSTATVDGVGRETTQTATIALPGRTIEVTRNVAWNTVKNLPESATVNVGGAGSAMSATFDDTDRLTDVTGGLWGSSGGLHMEYDRATSQDTTATGAKTLDRVKVPWGGSLVTTERTFDFSDSGRLSQVKLNGSRTIDYSWDTSGTGNLLSVADSAGTTTTFESANGHVTKATTGANETTYVYGDTGRRESETLGSATTTYGWVGDDTLASWQRSGTAPASASYTYDGDGQRMGAVVTATSAWSPAADVETTYTYGWDGLALRYVRANSSVASATIDYLTFGEDRPFAGAYTVTRGTETTSAVFQLMANDHGDIVALADEAGEVFCRYSYGPYGEAEGAPLTRATARLSASLATEIAEANPIRYAGYVYDTWSGHYYLQARYYDPATKQFISKDPAEADGEESAYQYCAGDPIHQVDPTGLWGWGGLTRAFSRFKRSVSRTYTRAARVVRSVARKVTRRAVRAYKHAKTRIVAKARAVRSSVASSYRRAKSRVRAFAAAAKQRARAAARAVRARARSAAAKAKKVARGAVSAATKHDWSLGATEAYAATVSGSGAGAEQGYEKYKVRSVTAWHRGNSVGIGFGSAGGVENGWLTEYDWKPGCEPSRLFGMSDIRPLGGRRFQRIPGSGTIVSAGGAFGWPTIGAYVYEGEGHVGTGWQYPTLALVGIKGAQQSFGPDGPVGPPDDATGIGFGGSWQGNWEAWF